MRVTTIALCLAAAAVLGLSLRAAVHALDPNALWKIVHDKCVPDQVRNGNPAPCAAVDLTKGEGGYAVLKDIVGATQFLLIPTKRIVGIEDPALLEPGATNYFAAAWQSRRFVEKALGHPTPDDILGLAVNSKLARSQNQLHIHIDCIRVDVRDALDAVRERIGQSWAPLARPIDGHPYEAMRVNGTTLDGHNPFKLLAQGFPGTPDDRALRTLVVVGMIFDSAEPGFVILEDRADPARGNYAGGSRLLDHGCALGR